MGYPSWYAVEEIDKSIDDTKELLLPFDLNTWLKMAVIVIFTGGFISGVPATGPSDIDYQFEDADFNQGIGDIDEWPDQSFSDSAVLLILGAVGGVFLLFSYISSVFQFIFFQSVNEKRPRILSGFKNNWLNGLKYFIYRILMAGIGIATALFLIIGIETGSLSAVLAAFTLMIPVWILMYLISFTINNFTVPRMSTTDSGFIESTKLAFTGFRDEWKQAGVFILVKIALGIAVITVSGIINLIAVLSIGLPLAFIAIIAYSILPVLVIPPLILGLIMLMLISLAVAVPLRTYIVQYVLNTYRKFEPEK